MDIRNNIYLISGSKSNKGEYDVQILRLINTKDSKRDAILDIMERDLIFAFGSTDDFTLHTETIILKNIKFERYQICCENCLECNGPEHEDCAKFAEKTNE